MDRKKRLVAVVAGIMVGILGVAAVPAAADVVHLKNGRAMEGVLLEETADRILLQLPFGEIGLPRASVLAIERGQSDLEQYLKRRLALEQRPGTASDWLTLAFWATERDLDHNAREATLVAARLDPGLPGLIPLMTAMGYDYEENLAVWIPHDELMRRRGYVMSNGRWITAQQATELRQASEVAAARELERQRQDRLARAMEMVVLTQMAQAEETRRLREQASTYQAGIPLWGGYPVVVPPGYWPRPPLHPRPHRGSRKSHRHAIVNRPPGSLIPITPVEGNRGGFQKSSDPQ